MIKAPITELIPIYNDDDGRLCVSGTRVLLDLVVHAFNRGETPEHIVQMYPTLTLENLFLALGYYLRHRQDVDTYVGQMDEEGERLRREYEESHPPHISKAELKARLDAKRLSADDAP